jgi:hypothetical protein
MPTALFIAQWTRLGVIPTGQRRLTIFGLAPAMVTIMRAVSRATRIVVTIYMAPDWEAKELVVFAPEASCDFSAPTQLAFRDHLRGKGITCDDEPVPSPRDCLTADHS